MLKKIMVVCALTNFSLSLGMLSPRTPAMATSPAPAPKIFCLDGRCVGSLTVYTGCMHSAKSQKLIDFIQGSREHGKKVVEVFKPTTDTRKGCYVTSRSSSVEIKAHCITEPREIVEHIQKQVDYVAIDEAQFLPREGMEEVVQELIRRGIGIVAAGLDMDFRGKPFGGTDLCMPSLLAQAEEVVKLKAFCAVCHAYNATMTQRLVNGQPAHYSDPLISVDDGSKKEIEYQPRCRGCHQIPD